MKTIAIAYLIIIGLISALTFVVYGWDKRKARLGGWRTPESRLHLLAFLGGWPGAMLGQRFFRHKTHKTGFKILTWLAAVLHASALITFIYLWLQGSGV